MNQQTWELREKNRSLLAGIKLAAFNQFFLCFQTKYFRSHIRKRDRETTLLSSLKAVDLNLGPLHSGYIVVRFQ